MRLHSEAVTAMCYRVCVERECVRRSMRAALRVRGAYLRDRKLDDVTSA